MSPAFGRSNGGIWITLRGEHLLAERQSAPEILVGTRECGQIQVLSSDVLLCRTPSGVGSYNISVIANEPSIKRQSTWLYPFIQGDLIFIGISDGLQAVMSVGPLNTNKTQNSSNLVAVSIPPVSGQKIVQIKAVISFGQRIVLGGKFVLTDTASSSYTGIVEFSGRSLQSLGFDFDGGISCLAFFQDSLFIGGTFTAAFNANNFLETTVVSGGWTKTPGLAILNGGNLLPVSSLGVGLFAPSSVTCLFNNGTSLYIAGHFPEIGDFALHLPTRTHTVRVIVFVT